MGTVIIFKTPPISGEVSEGRRGVKFYASIPPPHFVLVPLAEGQLLFLKLLPYQGRCPKDGGV